VLRIVGLLAQPIATQGRSYKGQCWLEEISKAVAPRANVRPLALPITPSIRSAFHHTPVLAHPQ
jgi:hypothetical protein